MSYFKNIQENRYRLAVKKRQPVKQLTDSVIAKIDRIVSPRGKCYQWYINQFGLRAIRSELFPVVRHVSGKPLEKSLYSL